MIEITRGDDAERARHREEARLDQRRIEQQRVAQRQVDSDRRVEGDRVAFAELVDRRDRPESAAKSELLAEVQQDDHADAMDRLRAAHDQGDARATLLLQLRGGDAKRAERLRDATTAAADPDRSGRAMPASERRIRAEEVALPTAVAGSQAPSALPIEEALAEAAPADAPSIPDLEQLVAFALVGRDSAGHDEIRVGLQDHLFGGAEIRIVGYGGKRVGLRLRHGPLAGRDAAVGSLVESLRARGIEVTDVRADD